VWPKHRSRKTTPFQNRGPPRVRLRQCPFRGENHEEEI
jgi:hypothetical protein